jgi:hypothetical protein
VDESPAMGADDAQAAADLAGRWPKGLAGTAEGDALARRWLASRAAARRSASPPHPHHRLTPGLVEALFEARRARRLVRGLEACESALVHQAAGVKAAATPGPAAEARERAGARSHAASSARISRLLVVSCDGAARFYRSVDQLAREHRATLEILIVLADELELGQAIYGSDQRVRAVLVEHKEAVARTLRALVDFEGG